MTFSFEQFAGLHLYLIVADLIFSVLDRIVISIYENLLSPVINTILGKSLLDLLTIQIGPCKKDVIKIGDIIAEVIKMFIILIMIFYTYKFAKKYEKFKSLKK